MNVLDEYKGEPLKYKYETHMHTRPVSGCAQADVRENLEFYKSLGYAGVFITNHFLDGNINIDRSADYRTKIEFYFSDYENAVKMSEEIGIKVFCGVEMSYKGTDFLVYGLDKEWYLQHPEIMEMEKSEEMPFLMENGALVIQAHPYREAEYIDHIRLFPRCVHGVEIINTSNDDFVNTMAIEYAKKYELLKIAGSDNHKCSKVKKLAGVSLDRPLTDEADFIKCVKNGSFKIFTMDI